MSSHQLHQHTPADPPGYRGGYTGPLSRRSTGEAWTGPERLSGRRSRRAVISGGRLVPTLLSTGADVAERRPACPTVAATTHGWRESDRRADAGRTAAQDARAQTARRGRMDAQPLGGAQRRGAPVGPTPNPDRDRDRLRPHRPKLSPCPPGRDQTCRRARWSRGTRRARRRRVELWSRESGSDGRARLPSRPAQPENEKAPPSDARRRGRGLFGCSG